MDSRKSLSIAISLLIALAATASSFILIELIALKLLVLHFGAGEGDTAGWGFLILQPIILSATVPISLFLGFFAYRRSFAKLR